MERTVIYLCFVMLIGVSLAGFPDLPRFPQIKFPELQKKLLDSKELRKLFTESELIKLGKMILSDYCKDNAEANECSKTIKTAFCDVRLDNFFSHTKCSWEQLSHCSDKISPNFQKDFAYCTIAATKLSAKMTYEATKLAASPQNPFLYAECMNSMCAGDNGGFIKPVGYDIDQFMCCLCKHDIDKKVIVNLSDCLKNTEENDCKPSDLDILSNSTNAQ